MRSAVGHYPGLRLVMALFFVFLYAPMLVLIGYSFNTNKLAMIWGGFSTRWYGKIFESGGIGQAALNSLYIATVAAAIATLVAVSAALVLARNARFRGASFSIGLISLPLVVPEIVTAVATLIFFVLLRTLTGFDLGRGNIVLAHSVFCIPFAFMPIRARLQDMDTALENAARDL